MSLNWLKKVTPWISAAATGGVPALVGMAAQAVTGVIGKDVKPDVDSIASAIAGATPEQLLALKQADNDLAAKMQAMGFQHEEEIERIMSEDRANARQRQVNMRDWTPTVLAFLITIGFFATLWFVFVHGVRESSRDLANLMTGVLGTAWVAVVTYYFGSSKGSDDKTKLLAQVGAKS